MGIEELRIAVNELDDEIARLIAKRTRLARDIGRLKLREGLPVRDPLRESEILERASLSGDDNETRITLRRVYLRILEESRRVQRGASETQSGRGEDVAG